MGRGYGKINKITKLMENLACATEWWTSIEKLLEIIKYNSINHT